MSNQQFATDNMTAAAQLKSILMELQMSAHKSRERSLALTNLQQAEFWLMEDSRLLLSAGLDAINAAAVADPEAIRALATALPDLTGASGVPLDIQWMPPGTHIINGTQNDKPVEKTVTVNAATAATLQRALGEMLAAVERGDGDRPYFDFNHDDGPASAWPTEFYWAGDDPKTGGVRAKLEWSGAGKQAVEHKTFRRFSPSFFLTDKGEVSGAPVNMGGLVNRAAFRKISPIWSKSGDPGADPNQQPNPTQHPTMKSLLAYLAKHGIIQSAEVDEATAISQATNFTNTLAEIRAKADKLPGLETQITTLQGEVTKAKKAHAESVVEGAIKAGRIPPKDDALKARWVKLIEDDPKNEDLLPATSKALDKVVQTKGASEGRESVTAKGDTEEHPFLAKAREIAKAEKISEADAVIRCSQTNPKLYEEYREALYAR